MSSLQAGYLVREGKGPKTKEHGSMVFEETGTSSLGTGKEAKYCSTGDNDCLAACGSFACRMQEAAGQPRHSQGLFATWKKMDHLCMDPDEPDSCNFV